jgi:hypothetical protein
VLTTQSTPILLNWYVMFSAKPLYAVESDTVVVILRGFIRAVTASARSAFALSGSNVYLPWLT